MMLMTAAFGAILLLLTGGDVSDVSLERAICKSFCVATGLLLAVFDLDNKEEMILNIGMIYYCFLLIRNIIKLLGTIVLCNSYYGSKLYTLLF